MSCTKAPLPSVTITRSKAAKESEEFEQWQSVSCTNNFATVLQSVFKCPYNRTFDHSETLHDVAEWHNVERQQKIFQIAKKLFEEQ